MKKRTILTILLLIVLIIILTLSIIFIIKLKEKIDIKLKKEKEEAELVEIFQDATKYSIFLEDDADVHKLKDEILNINGVISAEFISKEDALEIMKERFKDNNDLLEGYEGENNVFPNSYIVQIELNSIDDINSKYFGKFINEFEKIEGVQKVTSSYETYINIYENYGIEKFKKFLEEVEEKTT